MKKILLATALTIPANLDAQAFSESMADCAAIYQNAAQWVKTDEAADRLMYAALRWADAAVEQAQIEGNNRAEDAMWHRIDSKTSQWETKGQNVFFSKEFRDGTQYCRNFAEGRSISTEP